MDPSYPPRGWKGAEARPSATDAARAEAVVVRTGLPTWPTWQAGR